MKYPEGITHDLVDKASFHIANRANTRHGGVGVLECYENQEVTPDFVPCGYPEYNPVEQLFGWLKAYMKKKVNEYHDGSGWSREQMREVLLEAKSKVTYELVKGWYRNSFEHMHPGKMIPLYLRAQ
ncbi:hypothetical protein AKO1_002731 [Acrasis kona]|uniref:Tc1-like transposase DDE domain-containing protein n=1 Tax=Acrasis kona TaxID=1008807 RepID=A0AAW2YW20_9EUKA